MARNQISNPTLRGTVGILLLAVGGAVLVTYCAALAWQLHATMNNIASDSLGFLGSVGLASLHAIRVIAFDHSVLLSVIHRMLLSCSALIVILIGIALLKKGGTTATRPGSRNYSAPKGDQ